MTQTQLPNNLDVRQHGGLWDAAYHLIHPEGSTLHGDCEFYDVSTIINKNFVSLRDITEMRKDSAEAGGQPITGVAPNLVQYSTPGVATPLVDAAGNRTDLRGDTITFVDQCGDVGISNPKCVIATDDGEPPEPPPEPEPADPSINNGCCPPKVDCPECEPCEDAEPCVAPREKTAEICCTYGEFCVPVIYAGNSMSTFKLAGSDQDPWLSAKKELLQRRSCAIEFALLNGAGQVDSAGNPAFGCLGGGNVEQSGNVGVIRGGVATSIPLGIALLEEALAACLCTDIGMIHAPASVAYLNCEGMYHDEIDYGDGMGPRTVTRTKARGNIVVAGGGYTGAMGPDGCPCEPGEAWIYATSMVHLVYGHPIFTPDRSFTRDQNGNIKVGSSALSIFSNDVLVLAEQAIVPVYSKCCRFAVKVTGC